MNIANLASSRQNSGVPDVPLQSLVGNRYYTNQQKIGEACEQFEALLLKQFLAETQKPIMKGELTDNSTATSIYRDMISTQLANSLAKTHTFGLARAFDQQLSRQTAAAPTGPGAKDTNTTSPSSATKIF